MSRVVGLIGAIAICSCGLFDRVAGQSLPKELKEWTLEYGMSGGIAGIIRHITVTGDGAVTVEDRVGGLVGRVPDDLITRLAGFLKVARDEKPPAMNRRPIPDAMSQWLSVKTGGRDYRLEVTPEIAALIDDIVDRAGKQAVVGTWWQSGWKLCTPASKLAASDMAAPIETLVLKADGTFSVIWKNGGARPTGIPHVAIPDYSGRYGLFPESGSVRMRIDSGISVPPDFSGQGSFRVTTNQLTFRNVWFGTKQATHKPDICELTFTRQ
jgi:hypothetical protein